MAASSNQQTVKFAVLGFVLVDLLVGLACFACGIWFHASKDVYAYLTIFVRDQNDRAAVGAAGIFLATGILLSLMCLLLGFAVFTNRRQLIVLCCMLMWVVLLLGLICGFMAVGIRFTMHLGYKQGMMSQLQNSYTWDNRVGLAWNRVQVKKRCCGVDGAWDYRESAWFSSQNSNSVKPSTFVPISCCALQFDQDQWLYWVDPQNPQLRDALRCQQDAEGYKDNSANMNELGCFAALFSKNKDLWHDQSIFTVLNVIAGLGLTAGFLQIFALMVSCWYLAYLRQESAVSIAKRTTPRY